MKTASLLAYVSVSVNQAVCLVRVFLWEIECVMIKTNISEPVHIKTSSARYEIDPIQFNQAVGCETHPRVSYQ